MSFVSAFEATDDPLDFIEWVAEENAWDEWDEQQEEETCKE